jgi:hypothetical protein
LKGVDCWFLLHTLKIVFDRGRVQGDINCRFLTKREKEIKGRSGRSPAKAGSALLTVSATGLGPPRP